MSGERLIEKITEQMDEAKESHIQMIRQRVPIGIGRKTQCSCGNEIPKPRRQLGYECCTECALHSARMESRYFGK